MLLTIMSEVCVYIWVWAHANCQTCETFPILWFALRGTFWKLIREKRQGRIPQCWAELDDRLFLQSWITITGRGEPMEWHINHGSQSVSSNVFAPLNLNKQHAGDPNSDKGIKERREREMGLFEPKRVWMGRCGLEWFPDTCDQFQPSTQTQRSNTGLTLVLARGLRPYLFFKLEYIDIKCFGIESKTLFDCVHCQRFIFILKERQIQHFFVMF